MKHAPSKILLLLGILLLTYTTYLFYIREFSNKLYFNTNVNSFKNKKNKIPTKIIIPALKKELNIYQSEIKNNKWESFDSGVSYLKSSPVPGEIGNSIIYGHNWKTLLENLNKVVPGDKIMIKYDDLTNMNFEVENTAVVKPTQTDIVKNSKDRRLTIYTCTGFLDRMRFVIVAKPIL